MYSCVDSILYIKVHSNPHINAHNNQLTTPMSQLKLGSDQLCIEAGRHNKLKLTVELRLCKFCDSNEVESDAHFMMHCSLYQEGWVKVFTNVLKEDLNVSIMMIIKNLCTDIFF